ncbi:MAG TPA: hypothetical protein VF862_15340, partial [Gemmatimonadales bacterium]
MRRTFRLVPVLLVLAAASAGAQQADTSRAGKKGFGSFTPGTGFKVADTEHGDLNLKLFTYIRYLNQLGLDDSYTDAFGNDKAV